MLEILEEVFRTVVEYCALGLEIVGVIIVVWTAIKCVYEMFKHDANVRLDLAEGHRHGAGVQAGGRSAQDHHRQQLERVGHPGRYHAAAGGHHGVAALGGQEREEGQGSLRQ